MAKRWVLSSKLFLSYTRMIFVISICIICQLAVAQQQQGNETSLSRRLKIAVPVKDGFTEFAEVRHDPTTGEPTFSGFTIDIFKAVVNSAMAYTVSFDFVPFAKSDGTMNGTYDDMLNAVFRGDYDAAVGDITIRYYRTEWVDFTMPYSDSGVSMLVPLRLNGKQPGSALTKVAKGLIGATVAICFLCLLAALIPFFFDSGEKEAKRTRLVTVICFLSLVVISTCLASIVISLVTAHRPTPVIEQSIDDLIRKGRNVGYQTGSFVFNMLTQRGFMESQLKPYSTIDQLSQMFSKESEQGGIDAAIDETPYLKLFLTQRCNAYTIVASADMHGDGLSFAFRKGSSLVHDVSVAILKVTNNDEQLRNITRRTIGNLDTCLADIDADSDVVFDWEPTKWILVAGGISVVLLIIILILGYRIRNT